MTVETLEFTQIHDGDGVSTTFPFDRPFDEAGDLKASIIAADGARRTPAYIVETGENGGTVTITDQVPAADERVFIERDTQLFQRTNYSSGNFPSRAHEDLADRLVMAAQERKGVEGRTLRIGSAEPEIDPIAPIEAMPIGAVLVRTPTGFGAGPSSEAVADAADNAAAAMAARQGAETAAGTATGAATAAGQSAAAADQARIAAEEAAANVQPADYASAAAIAGLNVKPAAEYLRVAGHADPGDGGGGLYAKTAEDGAAPPSHKGYVLDAAGRHFALTRRTVRASQFGAFPADTAAERTAQQQLIDAIAYLMSPEIRGGELILDGNGPYWIGASVARTLPYDLEINWTGEGIMTAIDGLAAPVLDLRGGDNTRRLSIEGPRIDASRGITGVGVQGCTALNIQYFREAFVRDVDLYGGDNPENGNADSGVSAVANTYAHVSGGRIRGFGDVGLYPGGDNTLGPGGDGFAFVVSDLLIERCKGAISAKRELHQLAVGNCDITECLSGVMSAESGTEGVDFVLGVRRMDLQGNRFKKITANVARFRGHAQGSFIDNDLEDWGRTWDGATSVGSGAYALVIQGAKELKVSGNTFGRKLWAADQQAAVRLENITLDSTEYVQGQHHFHDNTYESIPRVVVEAAGGNSSTFENEMLRAISGTKFTGLSANTVVTYRETGFPYQKVYRNGVTYESDAGRVGDQVTIDLSSIGILANGSSSAVQTVAVPGAAVGDEVSITRDTSDLANSPEVLVSARAVPDQVQYRFRVTGATPFDFAGEIMRVTVRRP